jgi:dihydroorotase
MNPPLRNVNDVNACVEGLADGTIDAIASDHAPHLTSDKELEFQFAPCGIIGLETTIGVLMTDLVHAGKLTFERMISALTSVPAGIIGIDRGTLEVGKIADVTIIDTEREWVVNAEDFRSKSVNCPFIGRTLKGRPVATIISGDIVYREEISR